MRMEGNGGGLLIRISSVRRSSHRVCTPLRILHHPLYKIDPVLLQPSQPHDKLLDIPIVQRQRIFSKRQKPCIQRLEYQSSEYIGRRTSHSSLSDVVRDEMGRNLIFDVRSGRDGRIEDGDGRVDSELLEDRHDAHLLSVNGRWNVDAGLNSHRIALNFMWGVERMSAIIVRVVSDGHAAPNESALAPLDRYSL